MKGTKRIRNHKATVHKVDHFLPEQIERMQENANRQEKIIARIFYNNKSECFGPQQLHDKQGFGWPITSTRRAFTNLSTKKEIKNGGVVVRIFPPVLHQTEQTRPTKHGRNEHKWRWKRPEDFKDDAEQGEMFSLSEPESKSKAYSETSR